MARPTKNEDGFMFFSKEGDPKLFFCGHNGFPGIDYGFVNALDELRYRCGFPFRISSGYRSASHPAEAKKDKPGTHHEGIAADILVDNGYQRAIIVQQAQAMGFNGIGVHRDFVHVDMREAPPVLWTY